VDDGEARQGVSIGLSFSDKSAAPARKAKSGSIFLHSAHGVAAMARKGMERLERNSTVDRYVCYALHLETSTDQLSI